MARFCTWCGAPLEPGARFCGECGGRIPKSATSDGARSVEVPDVLSGFGMADSSKSLPADATLRMDRDAVVVPMDNEPKRFTLDGVKKRPSPLAIAGIVVAVLIAIGAIAFTWTYFQGGKGDSVDYAAAPSTEETSLAETASSQNESSAPQKVEDKAPTKSATPAEAYAVLDAAYEKLSTYDERIGDCVDDFNAVFLARSMSDRSAAKDDADQVLSDLQADATALEELKISSDSPYAETLRKMLELYECQIGRISAMTEAWALDVTFETPSEHKDEILAKYREGNPAAHLSRYDELYPSAVPSEM